MGKIITSKTKHGNRYQMLAAMAAINNTINTGKVTDIVTNSQINSED
jgi:hypothetical protein